MFQENFLLKMSLSNLIKKTCEPIVPGIIAYNRSLILDNKNKIRDLLKKVSERNEKNGAVQKLEKELIKSLEHENNLINVGLAGLFELATLVPIYYGLINSNPQEYGWTIVGGVCIGFRYALHNRQKIAIKLSGELIEKYQEFLDS